MTPKFKEYFQLMLKNNTESFDKFRVIHDKYALNPDDYQEELNEVGSVVVKIIRQWEDKLCNRSEGSGYGKYSTNLAEKFQNEVRREFPKIDCVGLSVFKISQIKPS